MMWFLYRRILLSVSFVEIVSCSIHRVHENCIVGTFLHWHWPSDRTSGRESTLTKR